MYIAYIFISILCYVYYVYCDTRLLLMSCLVNCLSLLSPSIISGNEFLRRSKQASKKKIKNEI